MKPNFTHLAEQQAGRRAKTGRKTSTKPQVGLNKLFTSGRSRLCVHPPQKRFLRFVLQRPARQGVAMTSLQLWIRSGRELWPILRTTFLMITGIVALAAAVYRLQEDGTSGYGVWLLTAGGVACYLTIISHQEWVRDELDREREYNRGEIWRLKDSLPKITDDSETP